MKKYTLLTCTALLLASETFAAKTEIPGLEINGNVSLVSDYIFRGITQTDNKPAIQGGFDLTHESGLYASIWGSNVDFGGEESLELDYIIGYKVTVSDVTINAGYIYYDYPGARDLDFDEVTLSVGYEMFTLLAAYGWNFAGVHSNESLYLNLEGSFDLPYDVGLSVAIGHQEQEAGKNYWDYSIGFEREFLGLDFGLAYTDVSDIDLGDNTDTIVASVSKEF